MPTCSIKNFDMLIKDKQISPYKLSETAGVSVQNTYSLMYGRKVPVTAAVRIFDVLNRDYCGDYLSIDEFIEGTTEAERIRQRRREKRRRLQFHQGSQQASL